MRYLRVVLLLAVCSIGAGCAANSGVGAGRSEAKRPDPIMHAARYDDATIRAMLTAGTIWLERDTTSDTWMLRDSIGVVVADVKLVTPDPEMKKLDAKYGVNLVK